MNLQPKRIDFSLEPLKIEELSHNPIEQFTRWWQQAVAHVGEGSDAACLSSVDAKGHANARIVLLKDFNERGFVFFTNYESTKGQELKEKGRDGTHLIEMTNGRSNVLVVGLEKGVEFDRLFGDQHAKGTEHGHAAVLELGFAVLLDDLPFLIGKVKGIKAT